MKKSRILSLLLAALMLSTPLYACSDDGEQTSDDSAAADTTVAETEPDPLADPFPEDLKYNGYNFRFYGDIGDTFVLCTIYRAEEKGETVNDAVFNRNKQIEERFDVKLTHVQSASDVYGVYKDVGPIIQSGDDFCDIICGENMKQLYTQNALVNLREVEAFDFSKPWWMPAADSLTVNNKLYTIQSAIAYNMLAYARVIYANADLAKANNIEFPYDAIREGKWYLDDWIKMTKDFYKDVNGNGTRDWNDTYGMAMVGAQWTTTECFGVESVIMNEQKTALIDNVMSPEFQTYMDKTCAWLFGGNPGFSYRTSGKTGEALMDMFVNGTLLSMMNFMQNPIKIIDTINFEYTILPVPKLDENQKDYQVASTGNNFAVPTTIKDKERTGTIIEAMSRLGYIDVFPAYKDLALRGRYSTNQDCADMIDIICDHIYISFANHCIPSNPQQFYREVWADQNPIPEIASKYAAKKSVYAQDIAAMNEHFFGK